MPINNSYSVETVNPLSEDFYRRYGLFEVSPLDTFVFNPTTWNQTETEKTDSFQVKKLPIKSHPENVILRKKKSTSTFSQAGTFKPKEGPKPPPQTSEEARFEKSSVILAIFVRFLLVGHNILTVWRVTVVYNDDLFWLILIANVLLIAEGLFTVCKRGGIDYKWWCPCFLIYLASTLPAIWLLQLRQYEIASGQRISGGSISTDADDSEAIDGAGDSAASTAVTHTITTTTVSTVVTSFVNSTIAAAVNATLETGADNTTSMLSTTQEANTTLSTTTEVSDESFGAPDSEVWLIIIEESLVYLLVFSRWLLPRRDMSREFLADLLLEFLAIASDIMELLAVFDETQVRVNLLLTYWVMAVWSASFIQFIPVLAQKRMFRHLRAPQRRLFTRLCGDSFVEIAYTCMSIFLQDGPFLVLRLYIMIRLKLITYSLVFFVLKNAVTLLLLVYRLGIMCYRLPCCRGQKSKAGNVVKKNINDGEAASFKDSTESLDDRI